MPLARRPVPDTTHTRPRRSKLTHPPSPTARRLRTRLHTRTPSDTATRVILARGVKMPSPRSVQQDRLPPRRTPPAHRHQAPSCLGRPLRRALLHLRVAGVPLFKADRGAPPVMGVLPIYRSTDLENHLLGFQIPKIFRCAGPRRGVPPPLHPPIAEPLLERTYLSAPAARRRPEPKKTPTNSHGTQGEGAHRAPRLGGARGARTGTVGAGRRPAPSSTFTFSGVEVSAPRTLSAPRQSYFQAMSAYLGAI